MSSPNSLKPVLIEVSYPSDAFCGPPQDLLQQIHVFPVLNAPLARHCLYPAHHSFCPAGQLIHHGKGLTLKLLAQHATSSVLLFAAALKKKKKIILLLPSPASFGRQHLLAGYGAPSQPSADSSTASPAPALGTQAQIAVLHFPEFYSGWFSLTVDIMLHTHTNQSRLRATRNRIQHTK